MPKQATVYGKLTALGCGCAIVGALLWLRPTALISLLAGFIVTALLGWVGIPVLQRLKTGQVIRSDGPQSHLQKGGTPTMGGAFWIPPALVLPLWTLDSRVWAVSALTLVYGLVGFWDDWQVITSRPGGPRGISARLKMGLLLAGGGVFCLYLALTGQPTVLRNFAGEPWLALGVLFWPLALFVLTATSNSVNLTDGLDGLAAGTGAIAAAALGLVVPAPLAMSCWVMVGCCLGFLVYNHNPARVFMGDTGSLALGGFLAGVALTSGQLLPLLIISGVFVAEAISVLLQVSYYKATKGADGKGKRLLKMAPLHHHLELSGWSETQVVSYLYGISLVLAVVAVWLTGLH
ncbi:phospho-N-acetylmuramoyl-pentapeptide-transferase [Candidatus Cyanaurora vandensis]|uniref:phospho-N-acetylmuramoyl-pentapeptide- transferase n=1 Tax=Candidatus Cyanaurora vandensis TaxID=2714958 RepID=UPI00257FE833|nr:phospho-N-acetylmuramoyl-pentapeptide-transferase [Candidatus Cyanaurora vandensis]